MSTEKGVFRVVFFLGWGNSVKTFRFFYRHLKPHSAFFSYAAIILISQSILATVFPLPIRYLIDTVFSPSKYSEYVSLWGYADVTPWQCLWLCVGLIFALSLVKFALDFLEEDATVRLSMGFVYDVRDEATRILFSRTQRFFDERRKADLLGRISGDVSNLEIFVTIGLATFLRSIPTLFFIVISTMMVDTRFAMILLCLFPLFYFSSTYFSTRIRRHSKKFRGITNHFEIDLLQAVQSMPLIKSLTMEKMVKNHLDAKSNEMTIAARKARRYQGLLTGSLGGSKNLMMLIVISLGGWAVFRGEITIGDLVLFITYIEAVAKPINEMAKFSAKYAQARASLDRVFEFYDDLENYPETGGSGHFVPREASAHLEFQNLDFSYPKARPILKNFTAEFHSAQMIGIVGPSGQGKTSFLKLLNRLEDPTAGKIRLDGVDLKELALDEVRRAVTLLSQEVLFLTATIRENLTLHNQNQSAVDEKIWEALRRVNAEDFVRRLPDGLNTRIGESGLNVSGGEGKRLSVARAFLRTQSRIFAFDEPTSGLDPYSSQVVMNSLRALVEEGNLVFVSTHSMNDLPLCDRVLYFSPLTSPILSTREEILKLGEFHKFAAGLITHSKRELEV
jgi:ABC-type multidrug transport system fused ATPase/permease subunit